MRLEVFRLLHHGTPAERVQAMLAPDMAAEDPKLVRDAVRESVQAMTGPEAAAFVRAVGEAAATHGRGPLGTVCDDPHSLPLHGLVHHLEKTALSEDMVSDLIRLRTKVQAVQDAYTLKRLDKMLDRFFP